MFIFFIHFQGKAISAISHDKDVIIHLQNLWCSTLSHILNWDKSLWALDFIFGHDKILAITTEYKMLLDSYVENASGEILDFGLEGSVVALGVEYTYKQKLIVRTGYSHGINRLTDSFTSLGIGLKGEYVDVDIAYLLGLSEQENPIREKLRLSLHLNLEEMF